MTLPLLLAGATALVLVAWAGGRWLGRGTGWVVATGLVALLGGVIGAWRDPGAHTAYLPWLPALDVGLRLRLDGLGLLFAVVVLGVGALVLGYAVSYLPTGRHGGFLALLAFFAAAMLGLVLADDLVLLWVMWEFTTITSFLLIAQTGPKGKAPAIRTLIVTGLGGLCLLAAVALTWTATGTTVLSDALASPVWQQRPGVAAAVATLVALAAFTKSAQFPFHAWLPDAMVASTPVSAYLHAAAMVKAGIYVLLRFSTALHEVPVWNLLLSVVGLGTALYGAVLALRRHDLKELLAYSTVSQLGLLVATIGVGTAYAMVGALVHVLAHAVFKSSLFMAVGLIDHEAGTRDLRRLSGLARAMPASSVVLTVAALSMAGMPPLFGFVSKEAAFQALSVAPWAGGLTALGAAVAVAAACCTVAYSARMLLPLRGPALTAPPHEAPVAMIAPPAVAALAGVVLGVAGPLAEPLVAQAAGSVTGRVESADLGLWHGLSPALAMSAVALLVGGALAIGHRPMERLLARGRAPVRAVQVVEAFRSGAVALGARVAGLTHSDAPYRHLLATALALVAVAAAGLLAVDPVAIAGALDPPGRDLHTALVVVLVGLLVVGVGLTVRARSRVALVTTVGVVGFSVSLLFFGLGASDVALTQLLVEILTVVVMVLLLTRLPGSFRRSTRSRARAAVVVGALTGLATFGIALVVLAHDELSDVGRVYLEQATKLTGGENVVNTILVDFRAMDTFGEMVVLGLAAVAVVVALESRGLLPRRRSPVLADVSDVARSTGANTLVLRAVDRVVGPVLVVLSAYLFLRGHYHPGGGFIAALIAGAGLCLVYLVAPDDRVARLRVSALGLVGLGVVVAVGTGLLGLVTGSFLRPLSTTLGGVTVSTGLIFDAGVYLAVLGLVLTALTRLGLEGPDAPPLRRPAVPARAESSQPTGSGADAADSGPISDGTTRSRP